MKIISAAQGQHIMKEIYRVAVESCRYLCMLFPTERKPGMTAIKVNAKFKCIFLKKIIYIAFYSQTLNDFVSQEKIVINIFYFSLMGYHYVVINMDTLKRSC